MPDDFTPSLHQLFLPSASSPLGSLLALCSSRRGGGRWDHSSPGFCALRAQPGTCRAEEATALRAPGRRPETRERVDLGEGVLVGSSVTAATTVPTSMGMLTVPKLGPPAQDLVGAVLPTATRHAGGRVIDFKPARQAGGKVGCRSRLPSSLAQELVHHHTRETPRCEGTGGGKEPEPEGTPRPSPTPTTTGQGARHQDEWGQDQEKGGGQKVPHQGPAPYCSASLKNW